MDAVWRPRCGATVVEGKEDGQGSHEAGLVVLGVAAPSVKLRIFPMMAAGILGGALAYSASFPVERFREDWVAKRRIDVRALVLFLCFFGFFLLLGFR